ITRDQMEQSAQQFQKQKQVEEDMQAKQQARQNVIQGEKFLAKNAKQPSVHVLPNGLQYKILTPGVGTHPTNTDQVTVNYTGRLINGEVFDSSYKRGQPITLPMAGVIPGWREALKLMQPGAMWELYIPAKLAYGERGMPPVIGQNQTLIFKVQLLSIQGK
ncbi:MAG: FKBP-type peptidyl-prolyl cis-trans isomerase, partial [Gammaproteobacteria bacterium]